MTSRICGVAVGALLLVLMVFEQACAEETVPTGELKSWTAEKIAGGVEFSALGKSDKDAPRDAIRFRLAAKDQKEPKARLSSADLKVAPMTKLTLAFKARRNQGDGECAVHVIEPSMLEKVGRRDGMEEQERMAGHVNVTIAIPAGTKEWKSFSFDFTLPKETGAFRIYLEGSGAIDVELADVTLSVVGKDAPKKPDF